MGRPRQRELGLSSVEGSVERRPFLK